MNAQRRKIGQGVVAAVLLLVSIQGLVLYKFARLPSELPAFLDSSNALVSAELGLSYTHSGLLRGIGDRIAAAAPPLTSLWTTQAEFNSDRAAREWDAGRRIELSTFEPWSVPLNPAWDEDPYKNITWQFYYHSLGWLWAPARECVSGPVAACRIVADYVLSWVRENPRAHPPSKYSWYDHSVAYRVDALVSLYPQVLARVMTPSEIGEVLKSLETHGQVLDGYVTGKAFRGHNHNLFHSLSLYNLALVFPELRNSSKWLSDRERAFHRCCPKWSRQMKAYRSRRLLRITCSHSDCLRELIGTCKRTAMG